MSDENKKIEDRVLELENKVQDLERTVKQLSLQKGYVPNSNNNQVQQRQPINQIQTQVINKEKKNKVKKEHKIGEAAVGKYFIGTLASILIFIAAVSLVSLIWGSLTNEMRLGLISGAGFILTALGFYLVKSNKNPVTAIILGTGSGLLFISILSANMYFNMISSEVAILLAGLWSIFFILSYKYTKMYFTTIIAYIGSFIALMLGLTLVGNNVDYIVLSVFVTGVASILLITSNKWLGKDKQVISILLTLLSYCALIIGGLVISKYVIEDKAIIVSVLTIILYLLLNYLYERESKKLNIAYIFINIAITLITVFYTEVVFNDNLIESKILFGLNLIQILWVDYRTKEITKPLIIYHSIISSIAVVMFNSEIFDVTLGVSVVALTLLILQRVKNKESYTKIISLLLVVDALMLFGSISSTYTLKTKNIEYIIVIYGIIQVTLMWFINKMYSSFNSIKEQGGVVYLISSYCIPYSLVSMLLPEPIKNSYGGYIIDYTTIESVVSYLSMSVVLIALGLKKYFNSPFSLKIYNFGTTIIYFIGLSLLADVDIWYEQLIMILALLGVALNQSYNIVKNYKDVKITGVWLGLKYLMLIWVVLNTVFNIEMESILLSISGLAIAIGSIASGFKLRITSLRLYGLILTILMVLKVIVVDLSQENSITRVVALLIGGVICFGITMLYNKLNKEI